MPSRKRECLDQAASRPPRHRLAGRILAIPAAFLLLALPSPAEPGGGRRPPEKGIQLVRAVDAIQEAFGDGQASLLRPLLPATGKVYLSSDSLGAEPGFYSGEQAEALLCRSFATLRTLRFRVQIDPSRDRGTGEGIVVCPASWTYTRGTARRETSLRFLLANRSERWTIREIREIR
jgi:hypothetical protein